MKTSIALLLVLCLTACSQKNVAPPAIALAPTVLKPAPSKPVDLTPVNTGLKPVTESNLQLREQIITGKRSITELNRRLVSMEASRQATIEEWKRLTALGEETRKALDESEKIQNDQRTAISGLERAVWVAQQDFIAADYEKRQLIAGLDKANANIEALTTEQQTAAKAAKGAEAEVAVAISQRDAEASWKWKFFWWGTTATVLLGLAVFVILKKPF